MTTKDLKVGQKFTIETKNHPYWVDGKRTLEVSRIEEKRVYLICGGEFGRSHNTVNEFLTHLVK